MGQFCIYRVNNLLIFFKNTFLIYLIFKLYRNPTPTEVEGILWKATTSFPLDYARIGNEMKEDNEKLFKMENDLYPERAGFWNELKAHYPAETDYFEFTTRKTMKGEL